jgi:hypothetical protein
MPAMPSVVMYYTLRIAAHLDCSSFLHTSASLPRADHTPIEPLDALERPPHKDQRFLRAPLSLLDRRVSLPSREGKANSK